MGNRTRESLRLGRGVYHLAEVARYTRIPANTIRNWFKGRSDRPGAEPVLRGDYPIVEGDYAVSFLDLIDAFVVGKLRDAGVHMREIRRAYQTLGQELNTPHAFAHSDIYTDGQKVFTRVAETVDDETFTEVVSHQMFFQQMQQMLSHICYDDDTRLAARWDIAPGIDINPQVSYGRPVVHGRGVTTFVLANAYRANNENVTLVADLYSVSEDDVLNAVRFEDDPGWRMAA